MTSADQQTGRDIMDLSVYLHWPFCKSKCPYCDFMSVTEDSDGFAQYLFEDLKISLEEVKVDSVRTVFFGGGTPSLMSVESVGCIIDFLCKNYGLRDDAEITIEANPATFDEQKLRALRSEGVNRLSLGIQSFHDVDLQTLGRIYGSRQAHEAAAAVAKHFHNFNFDFMYGYESQSLDDFARNLRFAADYGCPHVSCYQLTIEPHTPFFEAGKKSADDDHALKFCDVIKECLKDLVRYEISNYAKIGFESRHNLAYWRYEDYLGVGPSAHGRLTIGGRKTEMRKFRSVDEWRKRLAMNQSTYEVHNPLSDSEQLEETFIMGLRLKEGIDLRKLREKFTPDLLYPLLERVKILARQNFFKKSESKLQLSEMGLMKMNAVIEFLFT